MQVQWEIVLAVAAMLLVTSTGRAEKPTKSEIQRVLGWSAQRFGQRDAHSTAELPFTFTYDGIPSSKYLKTCNVERKQRTLDHNKTELVTTYTDPKTGLAVICRSTKYRDYPVIEWTLQFKNEGKANTPILSDIRSLDLNLKRSKPSEFKLHWNTADNCAVDSYAPHVQDLAANAVFEVAPNWGCPTTGNYPYWNIEYDNGGCIAVIGWPGQWSAKMSRDSDVGLSIVGGQELTHFSLEPGEEARSPLSVVLFYDGDWIRGQNIWRRWMVAHNLPRPEGKLVPTHYAACFSNLQPIPEEEIGSIEGFKREGVDLDFWILDAGWYPDNGSWPNTGTWEPDKARFPKGVKEVSDAAHKAGLGFVLWFEPERAAAGSWLAENHPEWISGGKQGGAVFIGIPECWKWIVEKFDGLIKSEGVDVYRQDHNIGPLDAWRAKDTPDRQGITENKDVTGYLAFWDELLRRNPKLWIDSCAGGGRRNDLETMRRSVPLLRSDAFMTPVIQQSQTYGLSLWLPYYGSGTGLTDVYMYRSCIFPASRVGGDARDKTLDYALLKRMIAEYRKCEPYILDDYYPLTPYSTEESVWMGWQFNSPEKGGGYVQAFRREEAPAESVILKLRGLNAKATYLVEDMNSGKTNPMKGKALMDGLEVKLPKRSSALFIYSKAK
jgi:alpha-galactosidase